MPRKPSIILSKNFTYTINFNGKSGLLDVVVVAQAQVALNVLDVQLKVRKSLEAIGITHGTEVSIFGRSLGSEKAFRKVGAAFAYN